MIDRSLNAKRGYTLIEVMISIVIFLVVMLVLYRLGGNMWTYNGFVQNSLITESTARIAVKKFIAELRQAGQGADGAFAIANASSTSITFFADVNKDGKREKVRYYLDATTTLMRGVKYPSGVPLSYASSIEYSKVVARNLVNATSGIFAYYDGAYNGITATSALAYPVLLPDVRFVTISISLDIDPKRSPIPMTFQSGVSIRSLKENL